MGQLTCRFLCSSTIKRDINSVAQLVGSKIQGQIHRQHHYIPLNVKGLDMLSFREINLSASSLIQTITVDINSKQLNDNYYDGNLHLQSLDIILRPSQFSLHSHLQPFYKVLVNSVAIICICLTSLFSGQIYRPDIYAISKYK